MRWDISSVFCPKLRSQHKAKAAEENPASEEMFTASTDLPRMEKWLVDSGALGHMTHQKEFLLDYREFATPEKVGVGDGRVVEALGIGNVRLKMQFRVSESKKATLHNVLYVPQLACNLFSVRAAASKSNTVKFGRCWIRNNDGELLGMGSLADKLYQLDCEPATYWSMHKWCINKPAMWICGISGWDISVDSDSQTCHERSQWLVSTSLPP